MELTKPPALILYKENNDFAIAYPNQSYCQRCHKQISSLVACPTCHRPDQTVQAFKLVWTQNPGMIVQQCIENPQTNVFHDHLGRPWTGKMLCNFLAQCPEQDYDLGQVTVN